MDKRISGVQEWATKSANIQVGCQNNCRYCYAAANALSRFGIIKDREEWKQEKPSKQTNKSFFPGDVVMFPTTHDIVPENLDRALQMIYYILGSGANLLIVSKPRWACIEKIMQELIIRYSPEIRARAELRFTLGSMDKTLTDFWEPGAPDPEERLLCLEEAFKNGFKTSVSSEPMLAGVNNALDLYDTCEQFITEQIWYGKMRNIDGRVAVKDHETWEQVTAIRNLQKDSEILKLYYFFKDLKGVAWKDSIKAVLEKNNVKL